MSEPGPLRRLYAMLAPGGFAYHDAHYLAADIEIDARAARAWVPAPLSLTSPATATVFTAWFPHNTFGSVYTEAGILMHVKDWGTRAVFCPWMIVDDDVALVLGRELLGYPKKMGAIDFRIDGDSISGIATRRGAELVRMTGRLGERVHDAPPMLGRPHRNVRSSQGLALPKLVAFTPHEEIVEVRRAELDVRIGRSDRDPLADLGFGRVRSAHLYRVNLGARGLPLPIRGVSPIWFLRQFFLRSH